jgi:predicted nucleotidyltransferase
MPETWRSELKTWAEQVAAQFQKKEGILGVVIGGSLARGQEWRHSDLELGILVEERDPQQSYFNIYAGRGVEAIQLVRPELEEQVRLAESGDLTPILRWPIQLWESRIVSDPTGLLARFKKQFDPGLFASEVIKNRLAGLRAKIDEGLEEARGLLAQGRPAAALVRTRLAMNEAILAIHWANGELPRSQNRTDSRLRQLCRRHSRMPFYALYREVFDLEVATQLIRTTWPQVKDQVLEITRLWGDSARDFFAFAVDGNFAWRQNAGILTVYRLYVPIIGSPERGIFALVDDEDWRCENKPLVRFLGLENAGKERVSGLVERVADSCAYFSSPSKGHS